MRAAKTIGFLLFSFAAAWVLFEISCFLLFEKLTGKEFDAAALFTDRQKIIDIRTGQEREEQLLYRLHPYLGYTGTPGKGPWGPGKATYNKFGFIGPAWDQTLPEEKLVVAVTGGSVAESFADSAEAHLNNWLDQLYPDFGKDIVVLNLAVAGYKQPQQLMSVQWALLNGLRIDAVVNIDGFNDIALALENIENEMSPLYPSGLHTASMELLSSGSADSARIRNDIERRKAFNIKVLNFVNWGPFRYSPAFCFIAERVSTSTHIEILKLHQKMQYTAIKKVPEYLRGVPIAPQNASKEAARFWASASRQLHKLCTAHGIKYLHVLQPNQYVPNSRNFTAEEREQVYDPNSRWGTLFQQGLPHLREEAAALTADGIMLVDATMVFLNIPEQVYTDSCCHFNDVGNRALAKPIAEAIGKQGQVFKDSPIGIE